MEDLRIHITRLEQATQEQKTSSPPSSSNAPGIDAHVTNGPDYCFGCGKERPGHMKGVRNCPEMKRLLADGQVKYSSDTGRIILADGSRLPYIPVGQPGGLYAFLQEHLPAPPSTQYAAASALNVILPDGHTMESFYIRDASYYAVSADPVLRSGKDTEERYNPIRRPEAKDKGKTPAHNPIPVPGPLPMRNDAQVPGPASAPQPAQPQKNIQIPPPKNPINRQDG
ncbi:hypothetical protein BDZ89DRAFT_1132889 [Hymenopellis radicata]|nr:hypothetical protein BDZ89DRAFT_1132889 [Hymenopellis radicata]